MKTIEQRLSKAREHLMLDQPWYGSLSMRLAVEISDKVQTASTNGTVLKFNPEFVATLSDAELKGIYAHETLHCALQHMYRMAGRDHELWNIACDFAINGILIKAGFSLPVGTLHDAKYENMSAEQIYSTLLQEEEQQGKPRPQAATGATGDFEAPEQAQAENGDSKATQAPPDGIGTSAPMTATDWQIAAEQASAVASKAGKLSGDCARAVANARGQAADWRSILREFIEQTQPSDYSWAQPNRRYLAQGLYLPGVVKENMPALVVAVDNSGSVSNRDLEVFAREITAIMHEVNPLWIDVVYCDSKIQKLESYEPSDPEIKLSACGGGGTRFTPVFEHIAATGEIPAALIYLTDLDCYDVPQEPDYPVLWVTSEKVTRQGKFGQTVRIAFE